MYMFRYMFLCQPFDEPIAKVWKYMYIDPMLTRYMYLLNSRKNFLVQKCQEANKFMANCYDFSCSGLPMIMKWTFSSGGTVHKSGVEILWSQKFLNFSF
jgi:hypothetical protein